MQFSNITRKKKALKKNIWRAVQSGYVQDRYEDDGTDRKKKEGRREVGKEGRVKKSNQQQNLTMMSDCSYCPVTSTENQIYLCIAQKLCFTHYLIFLVDHRHNTLEINAAKASNVKDRKQYGLSDSLTSTLCSLKLGRMWLTSFTLSLFLFLFIIHTQAWRLGPHKQTHYSSSSHTQTTGVSNTVKEAVTKIHVLYWHWTGTAPIPLRGALPSNTKSYNNTVTGDQYHVYVTNYVFVITTTGLHIITATFPFNGFIFTCNFRLNKVKKKKVVVLNSDVYCS